MLTILLCVVGCGAESGPSYPSDWTLEVSTSASALVADAGWDPMTFFEQVCLHAEQISDGSGLTFDLDGASGTIGLHGTRAGNSGRFGFASSGSGRADVNQGEIFDHLFGPAPERVGQDFFTMDEAAYLVAVIVVHEVGHALSLPHNANSTLMQAAPTLVVSVRHAYTAAEVERIHEFTGGPPQPAGGPSSCACCGPGNVPIPNCVPG